VSVADPFDLTSFEVTNGVPLKQQAQFLVRSVIIDNNTSAFAYHPDSGRYVPPGAGAAFGCRGTHHCRILWLAPPGRVQPVAVATEKAQVTFCASPTPPGTGIGSPQASTAPWLSPNNRVTINKPASGTVVITGVPGQIVYLHGMYGGLDAAVAGGNFQLQRTSDSVALGIFNSSMVGPHNFDFKGFALPVGDGAKIVLSAAMNLLLTLGYAQV